MTVDRTHITAYQDTQQHNAENSISRCSLSQHTINRAINIVTSSTVQEDRIVPTSVGRCRCFNKCPLQTRSSWAGSHDS